MRITKLFILAFAIIGSTFAYGEDYEELQTFENFSPEEDPECKECHGKIDTGPAYVNIDVLQNGKTIRNLNLFAWKLDTFYRIYSGIAVKGSALVGDGDARFYTLGGYVGFCFPVFDWLTLFPNVGYAGGKFLSKIDLPIEIEVPQVGTMKIEIPNVNEHIKSHGPVIGVDASFKIYESWRVCLVFQYAWSKATTHFTKHTDGISAYYKVHTQGPNYAVVIEHDIAKKWSLSLGAGYNLTLNKDKEGLRAKGAKIGVIYWF